MQNLPNENQIPNNEIVKASDPSMSSEKFLAIEFCKIAFNIISIVKQDVFFVGNCPVFPPEEGNICCGKKLICLQIKQAENHLLKIKEFFKI